MDLTGWTQARGRLKEGLMFYKLSGCYWILDVTIMFCFPKPSDVWITKDPLYEMNLMDGI